MAKYTTEAKIEAFLNESIASGGADDAIDSAEAYIDTVTGRNFKAVSGDRVFSGNGNQTMLIDDCIAITKLEVGSDFYGDSKVEVSSDDYIMLPGNFLTDKIPANEVWLKNRNWVTGLQNHIITAKWGYSEEAPADIVFAATFLASSIYKQGRAGNIGGIKSENIGDYSISFSAGDELSDFKKVQQILNSYKSLLP